MTVLSVARRVTFWTGVAVAAWGSPFSQISNDLLTDYGVHGARTPGGGHVHPMELKGVTVYLSAEQLAAVRNADDRAALLSGVGLMLMIGSLGLGWFDRRSNKAHGVPHVAG